MKHLTSVGLAATIAIALVQITPAQAGWEEGILAYNMGDYRQAEIEFVEVAGSDLAGFQAHFMLGLSVAAMQTRNRDAINHFRKAYDLNSNDLNVQVALAQAYSDANMHAAAEAVLGDSLKQVQRQLGFTYEKQRKYSESIEAFEQAGDRAGVNRVQAATRSAPR